MAGKYKRIYLGIGATLIGLFSILSFIGLQITDVSGDIVCAGTEADPCISYFDVINPTAKSVYIYNYDEVELEFSPDIERYELYVKYYGKWHYTNFTKETRFGNIPADRKYSFVFPRYSTKHFKLVGYKNNPEDDVKWGVCTSGAYLDPLWEGIEVDKIETVKATGIQVTTTDSWYTTITLDTENLYDVESAEYDGHEFKIILKVNSSAISNAESKIPKEPQGKGEIIPLSLTEVKDNLKIKVSDYKRSKLLATKDLYSDYNPTTGKKNYTVSMPAKYNILLADGNISVNDRREVTLKLGDESIYIVATLGTDLKVVQTATSNDTQYVAGLDVSESKLFFGATDSSFDVNKDLVLWQTYDRCGETAVWAAYDYSGNNHHGVPTNMNQGKDNSSSGCTSSGNMSRGVDFDGVDDYVSVADDVGFHLNDTLSVTAWVKTSASSRVINKWSGGLSKGWIMDISGGKFRIKFMDGTNSIDFQPASTINDNLWHLMAFTFERNSATGLKVYLDSSQLSTSQDTTSITGDITNVAAISIGSLSSGGGVFFNGTIDNVRIYDRALSPDEVGALHDMDKDDYITNYTTITDTAVTYDIIQNSNNSLTFKIPETQSVFSATPTYISTNYTMIESGMNTTNSDWFGNEVVSVTSEYLNEQNLTRVRVTNPYAMNQYDLLSFNLTSYLGWNPDDIQNVWYNSYTGNTDNSTLKDTSDYTVWLDTTPENKTGLVLDIRLEELQGTQANDQSIYNNNGEMHNMNTGYNNGSSGWTTSGKYGNALKFDGVDDYVSVSDSTSLNIIDKITVEAWINVKEDVLSDIITKYNGTVLPYHLVYLATDDTIRIYMGGESTSNSAYKVISLNEWYHVAGIYDGTNTLIYVNGIIGTNATTPLAPICTIGDVYIGARYDGNKPFNGTIDEVKIYNRALSPSEISNSYNRKKDYYNSLPRQESGITAGSDWDVFVQNGTVSSIATNRIVMKPAISTTEPTMWAIDFAFDSSGMSAYDTSCGTFEALDTTSVSTYKNGTYCISYPMENSVYGSQEKQNIGLWQFPQRYEENTYRTFFTIQENLTANTVIELPVNITEILDRTELTANVNDTTYKIYRINENGWVYNDTGICYEQPVEVGE